MLLSKNRVHAIETVSCLSCFAYLSMLIRFKDILEKLEAIDRDLKELRRLKNKIPQKRRYSDPLDISFDKQINELLNQKIELESLEIDSPAQELSDSILFADPITSSRIRAERIQVREAERSAKEERIFEFLREMPKTEIHLHMEACISDKTLFDIMERNNVEYDPVEVANLYKFKNLQDFVRLFLFILDAIKTPDDFVLIFKNLRAYLEANNIRYAEVFLAPSRMIANGLDFRELAEIIDHLASDCFRSGGPEVKYLIDVSRTFGAENASQNLQRVLRLKTRNIIGIGLGGAELMGPAREFKDVFAQARAEGLRCVAHAGEDDGPWSITDSVLVLGSERIGHATSAIQDPKLLDMLKEREIPLEICLTSNIFTGKYVREEKDHPVRRYYDEGLVCTVNTDDPEIFKVNLTEEYFKFYRHLDFTLTELIDLNRQGVYSSFQARPGDMWKSFQKEIYRLREKYAI